MQKFVNQKTGNTVRVKDAQTIKLMQKSNRYEAVKAKTGKAAKA